MYFFMNILFVMFMLNTTIVAKGILAGTKIVNVAHLNYQVDGSNFSAKSNILMNVVDQVLDLTIMCQSAQNVIVQNGELKRALPFILENTGNGKDNFLLTPDTNETSSKVENQFIYLDNGDGIFNKEDIQVNDINLTADTKATLFLVSDIPASSAWYMSYNGIEARSTIGGSGIAGSTYTRRKYAAVDGQKGGVDSAFCVYERTQVKLKLVKSSTLSSPKLFTGTIIHYKIIAKMVGVGTLNSVKVRDVIPRGTIYVKNSLELDGISLSDTQYLANRTLTISLGDMTQTDTVPLIHTIEFDVKVE